MVRGYPVHDPERCIGCGACSNVCPTDSINVDRKENKIVWIHNVARCIRCCYCVDNCPTGALSVGDEYSMIADSLDKLFIVHELDSARCTSCRDYVPYSINVISYLSDKALKVDLKCERCRLGNVLKVIEKVRKL
ncbi:MAG: 4Fe-4S dicluster domain-containing protein [Crenarchaeota archaeon]|nr:4Fe-4S dicluster domain-containing protein [Thermoproteota archaeon]